MFELSKRTIERLKHFPVLQNVTDTFILNKGFSNVPYRLTDLTIYIRMLDINEPEVFRWSKYTSYEFYSWGHNSRYANVLEPMLYNNLNLHLCRLLDYLEASEVSEPKLEDIIN